MALKKAGDLAVIPSKALVRKEPQVYFVQKVIKGETFLVMAHSAVELEDEFSSLYYTASSIGNLFLMPPFEPNVLLNLVQTNNILNQCIEAMEVNIDGTGHEFVPVDKDKEADKGELAAAEAFFNEPYPNEHFINMRRKLRRQMESVGYSFLEVLRNLEGTPVGVRNMETQHVRMVKLDAPVQVTKKINRNGKEVEMKMWERERRFAQTVALKTHIYYREYGTSRQVNRETGKWESSTEPVKPEDRGTELLVFGVNPDTMSPYYLPRWINQLPSVVGSRNAEEQNLQFLDAGGMPPAIIFVQGGALVKDSADQLRMYLSGLNKNKNRAVVVEVQSSSGSLDTQGKVEVKVERFGAERAQDAMFMKYDASTEEHVRTGFRLPPLFLGKAQDYNFATAKTSYMVAEAQVFAPERVDFDEVINKTLMKELGFTTLRYKSKPITLKDIEAQLKGLELSATVATRESYLQELNTATGMDLKMSELPAPNVAPGDQPLKSTPSMDETPSGELPAGTAVPAMTTPQKAAESPQDSHLVLSAGQKVVPKPEPKEPKTAVELIELAHDYAAIKGLVVKGDISPEHKMLVQEEVDQLSPQEMQGFQTLIAQYVFGDTDPDLVDIVGAIHKKEGNPYHDKVGQFTSKDRADEGDEEGDEVDEQKPGKALKALVNGKKANVDPSDVDVFLKKAATRDDDPDLTDLHVNGMQIFGGNGLGIKRVDMPQVSNANREVFEKEAKALGVVFKDEDVSPLSLSPSQSEISARKVGQMFAKHEEIMAQEKSRIYVSKDNYVLDGHHRWAMAAAVVIGKPKLKMGVTRLNKNHKEALKIMLEYNERHGIEGKTLSDAKKKELLKKYGW